VNQILSAAIRAEARYLERGNLPFGTSLFCLAQRSAAGEETKSAAARRLAQVKRS
jgi:hypothetical protein